ncbi:hypothetical protein JJJ17_06325 [Paracoccus caeni]|uniref:Uncharacterized protein n=1 Tax=Paracoccus caeni TaxID=657651 RepID=A0A934VZQ2_9RHOB|nr:hypothetical protein [Paracoccus caeni]MBK4215538.1 hypothetical protein [Paracoccus caeni]
MAREAKTFDDIGTMADEVSRLIAARFGGAKRGERPPLQVMLRRRGGALPRKLRRQAVQLATADRHAPQPKIARQQDMATLEKAHSALIHYLQPLGEISRWQGRAISFAASIAFGALVLTAVVVWILVKRGFV